MKNFKITLMVLAIYGFALFPASLFAQQLFTVTQNSLSKEKVAFLTVEMAKSNVVELVLGRNNENKEVFTFSFSTAVPAQIVIMNERTGSHVVVTPVKNWQAMNHPAEFQLAPFFIEELRQGALGDAERFLLLETTSDNSVSRVASVAVSKSKADLPRYFYGEKENIQEALPTNRTIIAIFKEKPRLIPAFPNDEENLRYVAQLAEKMSYYTYLYELPDETLCFYDEHYASDETMNASMADGPLQFTLSGNTTGNVRTATLHVFDLWSKKLAGKVKVDAQVDMAKMPAGTLGGSYVLPAFYHTSTQTWYPPALYNQIVGYDATTSRDIKIEMNSDYSWYYGLDGNTPSTLMDFTTVLLHEVNHGLGFSDNIYYEKGNANSGCFYYIDGEIPRKTPYPNTFSRQLYQGTSGPCITELTDAQRSALITSGNLYAGRPGSKLLAANGGNRVKMYAPNPYEDGSSVCHWDWGVSFKTFMRYAFVKGESCHVIGNRELGILIDMGWTENGGGTSDCSGPTGLTVNYSKNCTSAALSWKDPVSASPKGVVFSEGFEGSIDGWTVEKNGEEEWKIYTESATIKAHGGVRFAGHLWVLNKKRDAWLYSPAFQMNAGTKYTIKFWLRLPGYPEDGEHDYFELKIGQSNTISAMTTTLYNNTTTYIPDWTLISKEFTPSTTGTYHLGFHAFTPLNQGSYILIDDIEVSTGGSNFSYNIYRDGSKIASGIKEVYYTDSGFDSNKSHKWEVKTVCSGGGESNPASVTKGCTVGIDENENQEISIYPNPTSGEIKVQSSKFKVQSVEVFDVMGKKQKSRKAEEQNVLLDISDLSNGIYFVKITTESGVVTKKIIKY